MMTLNDWPNAFLNWPTRVSWTFVTRNYYLQSQAIARRLAKQAEPICVPMSSYPIKAELCHGMRMRPPRQKLPRGAPQHSPMPFIRITRALWRSGSATPNDLHA
jgi:hypothetical protein